MHFETADHRPGGLITSSGVVLVLLVMALVVLEVVLSILVAIVACNYVYEH